MFKRIKTLCLTVIGLLAISGTEAAAHYIYANGRWVYHSVGCEVTIGSIPLSPDPLVVICLVTTTQVEAKCPNQPIPVSVAIQVSLAAQQLLNPGQSYVEVIVDDAPLLTDGNIVSACGGSAATAVLIRNMLSTVTIQCVGPSLSCLAPLVPTSTATATCTLPAGCTLNNCPNNQRTYTTTGLIVTHIY